MIGVDVQNHRRRVDGIDHREGNIHLGPGLPRWRDLGLGQPDVFPHRRAGGIQLGDHVAPQIMNEICRAVGGAGVGDDAADQLLKAVVGVSPANSSRHPSKFAKCERERRSNRFVAKMIG